MVFKMREVKAMRRIISRQMYFEGGAAGRKYLESIVALKAPKTCGCCGVKILEIEGQSIVTQMGLWFNCECGSTLIAGDEHVDCEELIATM
jgi:hypothetical protein